MSKKSIVIFVAAFVVLVLLAEPVWLLLGIEETNTENRTLEALPALTAENYTSFPSDFTNWFASHLPFRGSLVTIHTGIGFAMNSSDNDRVILGRDGWLFYGAHNDGDPIACYMGTNVPDEAALASMTASVKSAQARLAEENIEFIVFVAPNKERIYGEYLPASYGAQAVPSQADVMVEALEKAGINIVWAKDALFDAKAVLPQQIYHKTDTHWNRLGGYVGTRVLLHRLGIDLPAPQDTEIVPVPNEICDLADMLNLGSYFRDRETDYTLPDIPWVRGTTTGHVTVTEGVGADPRTVLILHDSYGNNMVPYLGGQFAKVVSVHRDNYTHAVLEEAKPDVVILAYVERYFEKIGSFDPDAAVSTNTILGRD